MTHKEKMIVTGGAGFIGSHVVDQLVALGYEVHVIDNLVAGKREHVSKEAVLHVVDIRDQEKLAPIFKGATGVFHLAALPSVPYSIEHPVETHEVNALGTLKVLMAARDAKVRRVVFSSSAAVYGDQTCIPISEESVFCVPNTPYGLQKFESEHYMRLASELYGLETVCLRYFNLYGPRQNPQGPYASVIAKFLEQKKHGESLTVVGDGHQTRDFVHVEDVARANILAMQSKNGGKGEVINIGGGMQYAIIDIAHMIGGELVFLPPRVEIRDSFASVERARELLGWSSQKNLKEEIEHLMRLIS